MSIFELVKQYKDSQIVDQALLSACDMEGLIVQVKIT